MVSPSSTKGSPEQVVSKAYNFVIIGGGTAGLTLAAGLSEDPAISVLVLEAGEDRHDVRSSDHICLKVELADI
jgi:choline dehydrogenase-like flavoprotein